jgi:triphosphoribosyl-dephospho-CoA synthase
MARTLGERVTFAIQTECTAIKLGNVHPNASYPDLNHAHFMRAAKAMSRYIDGTSNFSVGSLAIEMTRCMMSSARTNTSLGTILLLAPLLSAAEKTQSRPDVRASNPTHDRFHASLSRILKSMTAADAQGVYEAIRHAKPGGMGQVESMDIAEDVPSDLLDAMRLASSWDDVALQYVTDFRLVLETATSLETLRAKGMEWVDAVRCVQVQLLAERVDSLIARKQGVDFAKDVQSRAGRVISSGKYGSPLFEAAWQGLDEHLRDGQHKGNPGTIADLIAAALFVNG